MKRPLLLQPRNRKKKQFENLEMITIEQSLSLSLSLSLSYSLLLSLSLSLSLSPHLIQEKKRSQNQ